MATGCEHAVIAGTAPGEGRARGQQPGAPGHGRTPRPALPVVVETLQPPERCCPHCARPYAANGASVTQLVEVEVSAHVRRIHRLRMRASCRCGEPSESVAPPPARLFAHTAYLNACAENAGCAPANLDPWLPWAMDDARCERLRHPYPVQPHGP